MSNGKHFSPSGQGPRGPWRFKSWRSAAACALVAVLAVGGVAGVIAWTTAQDALTNAFEVGKVDPVIEEEFDPTTPDSEGNIVKENVTVRNDGSIPIYVRAQVNIYWIDAAGNQLWETPTEGEDYVIEWSKSVGTSWVHNTDGYYYWIGKLAAGAPTDNLIDSVKQSADKVADDKAANRNLVVDIDIQGIQADPASAVYEAWGVSAGTDGNLSISSAGSTAGTSFATTTEEA